MLTQISTIFLFVNITLLQTEQLSLYMTNFSPKIVYHLSEPLDTINYPSLEMDHCHEMEFPDHYFRSKFIAFSNGMLQPLNFCEFQPQHRELDYQTARGGIRLSD